MSNRFCFALVVVLGLSSACGSDKKDDNPQGDPDGGKDDMSDAGRDGGEGEHDASVAEDASTPEDASMEHDGGKPADDLENSFGFAISAPTNAEYECNEWGWPAEVDYLCSFVHGQKQGTVYLRGRADGCLEFNPSFGAQAFFSSKGKVSKLAGAGYSWGGGHHNDSFTFTLDGVHYEYNHSSFGFGWRSCQPPDCMKASPVAGGQGEDGCTAERTLPVSCVEIKKGESYDPSDLVDTFMKCQGDPNL